jgi:ribonucleoside-diphosphate reductase beta chain
MPDIIQAQQLSPKIFNVNKDNYQNTPIFFGQQNGLFDSINKRYPALWTLYKDLKKNDWEENELSFLSCNVEFKTCDHNTSDMMILQLGWQWSTDSVAARSVIGILSHSIASSEIWAGYCQITANENVHALTYSEIVRMSFDNPDEVIKRVLSVKESQNRLQLVTDVFDKTLEMNLDYSRGVLPYSQELYEQNFMFLVALYTMERLQFMASFAITFAICKSGLFQPIGLMVQKIAKDEYEYHAPYGAGVIKAELNTPRGQLAFKNNRAKILALLNAVTQGEFDWADYSFSEGRTLPGMTAEKVKNWVRFNARAVYTFFGLDKESSHELIDYNPLIFMADWINIDNNQQSPQEMANNNYKVNTVNKQTTTKVFAFDRPGNRKLEAITAVVEVAPPVLTEEQVVVPL